MNHNHGRDRNRNRRRIRSQGSWNPKNLLPNILNWNKNCQTCGISLLSSEFNSSPFCCGPGGTYGRIYRPLDALPPEYDIFIDSPSISQDSRRLNLAFSFASLETSAPFLSPSQLGGRSFVVIQGRSYHRVRPGHQSSGVRWILYDGFEAGRNPFSNQTEGIPLLWIRAVRAALQRENRFVKDLISISTQLPFLPNATIQLAESNIAREIAAVIRYDNTALAEVSPRTIVIRRYGRDTPQRIPTTSCLWEPLVYPLLFPKGTSGWSPEDSEWYLIIHLLLYPHANLRSFIDVACQATRPTRKPFPDIWSTCK
jgi:hypothetical protein